MASQLLDKIKYCASIPQTPVSLRQMTLFGRKPSPGSILRASQFMRDELPIRLAHRVVELDNLPHELSLMPSVIKVKNWYSQSFQELTQFPHPEEFGIPKELMLNQDQKRENGSDNNKYYNEDINNQSIQSGSLSNDMTINVKFPSQVSEYNEQFAECLEKIKKRHDPVVTSLAQGILELKEHWKKTNSPLQETKTRHVKGNNPALPTAIQAFLDRFYMSRIGIRMLIGQHVTLSRVSLGKISLPQDYVGIICTKTQLKQVAEDAIENAKFVCQEHYGLWSSPEVKLILERDDLNFSYVPSHLHHMLFELLKNSLRAVVERYGLDYDDYPEIRILVAEGEEDITIKISDEGGGIPRSALPLVYTYMYTTARNPLVENDQETNDFKAPLAGFGYGLPLSRLYARYFGGDLKLVSVEGYGTDAYLHLSRLSDTEEPLP